MTLFVIGLIEIICNRAYIQFVMLVIKVFISHLQVFYETYNISIKWTLSVNNSYSFSRPLKFSNSGGGGWLVPYKFLSKIFFPNKQKN